MDINTTGIVFALILMIILIAGWITGHNGILTSSIVGIIAAISGAIFGYKYKLNKEN